LFIVARRLLEEARGERLEALYVIAVTAGLRIGELLGLRWQDVDLESAMLRVRRTKSTAKTGPRFTAPKNGKGRSIRLTRHAVDALSAHKAAQNAERLKAGLPDIRFHDLRHTCATLLLSRGHHPKLVQELLGYASVALTLDRYSHVLPGMGDQTAAAMEAALS
jgi:integrase